MQVKSISQTLRELGKLISPVFTGSANRAAVPRLLLLGVMAGTISLALSTITILLFSAVLQAVAPPEIVNGSFKDIAEFSSWLINSNAAAYCITLAFAAAMVGLWRARQVTKDQRQAWLYTIGILYLILILNATEVAFSYIVSSLNTAFSTRNESAALQALIAVGANLAILLPISYAFRIASESFQNFWRSFMSESLLEGYLANKNFYSIGAGLKPGPTRIDNPDQRISQDADEFTAETSQLLIEFFRSAIAATSFSLVLWTISQTAFVLIIGYAISGTLGASLIGRKLLSLNYKQLEYNADFRYNITQLRDNAESIAFYSGEDNEGSRLKRALRRAIDNKYTLIRNLAGLSVFNIGFTQVQALLPFALLWVPFFRGDIELGQIVQTAIAVGSVSAAFNFFATNYNSIVNLLANASRLEELFHAVRNCSQVASEQTCKALGSHKIILIHRASLATPDSSRLLVQNLDLDIQQTDRIMIVGPSGCGKTSLLRMVAGLWRPTEGTCQARSFQEGVIFVPQRPYLFTASLTELLRYPRLGAPLEQKDLQELLESVNLPNLLNQHPDHKQSIEWQRVLSMGEQQRIAFARILLSDAQFALLDEATSALDPNNERSAYQLLQAAGLGYMSVGHRASLLDYHDHVLKLNPGGSWELMPATQYVFD